MAEKVTAAQKRALEKFVPGEVRTVMGLNSSTLEALEKRALVARGKAALEKSSSNRGKYVLGEAVTITVAGYAALTGEEPAAEVVEACQKAALRLSLGAKADPGRLQVTGNVARDRRSYVAHHERNIENLRRQIEMEETRLASAKKALDDVMGVLATIKAERSEAALQYEALTGLTLLAGPGFYGQ